MTVVARRVRRHPPHATIVQAVRTSCAVTPMPLYILVGAAQDAFRKAGKRESSALLRSSDKPRPGQESALSRAARS
jgi:hypothetical protein